MQFIQLKTRNMKRKITYLFLSGMIPVWAMAHEPAEAFLSDSLYMPHGGEYASSHVTAVSDVFEKSPEYDVAKALYGRIPGLLVNQGYSVDNPTANLSSLSLHGRSPVVLIDGAVRSLDEITASEIESVSVLKDAVSSALYGVKGSNGVILVTTKRGFLPGCGLDGRDLPQGCFKPQG